MMEHLHATASATTAPTDSDLQLTLEELGMMETLVALAEDNKRKWDGQLSTQWNLSVCCDHGTVFLRPVNHGSYIRLL